jgi:AraC-like DNA-binding protein
MAYIIPSHVGVSIRAEGRYGYITICIKNKWKERLKHLEFRDYFLTFPSSKEIHKLCTDYIKNGSAEAFVKSIIALMQPIVANCAEKYERKAISNITDAACAYIRRHAQEKFSLDMLADAIHVSKFYLIKLFKKEMGVTPNQYYIQAKMHFVKDKIMGQQKEVDVAMELNFNDQSHLCNLFKRQMGISLQDYKKSFKELE